MALRCLLDANSFEDAVRMAVMCDGDTDTKAAITGSMAQACYEIPESIIDRALSYLPDDMLRILEQFYTRMEGRLNGSGNKKG